ncbi:MAG: hypothetical protein J0I06_20575 [Planctomycetes bacterium]|nr:hypothetical protein [Planctomycetota bacterium]
MWIVRDVFGGGLLSARGLPPARLPERSEWLRLVRDGCGVPVAGCSPTAGTRSARRWPRRARSAVPVRPVPIPAGGGEADRHAQVQLKKKGRGVRKGEWQAEE